MTCVTTSRNCLTCGFSQYGLHLFLYSSQCLQTCPNGYWPNISGNTCDACNSACLLCTSSAQTSCTKCGNFSTNIYYNLVHITLKHHKCYWVLDPPIISCKLSYFIGENMNTGHGPIISGLYAERMKCFGPHTWQSTPRPSFNESQLTCEFSDYFKLI